MRVGLLPEVRGHSRVQRRSLPDRHSPAPQQEEVFPEQEEAAGQHLFPAEEMLRLKPVVDLACSLDEYYAFTVDLPKKKWDSESGSLAKRRLGQMPLPKGQ